MFLTGVYMGEYKYLIVEALRAAYVKGAYFIIYKLYLKNNNKKKLKSVKQILSVPS